MWLTISILLLAPVITFSLRKFFHYDKLNICSNEFLLPKRTLIIIAHPDDECMFFSPVILTLLKRECHVTLLCMSNGKI